MRAFSKRALPIWLVAVVVLLVGARIALPHILLKYGNDTLDSIPGYYGNIEDIDVALWRGAYTVEKIELLKKNGDPKEPLFAADIVNIKLDWSALINGELKSVIELTRPKLQFVQRASKESSQTNIDQSWQQKVRKLYPFEINKFAINDGLIRYKDETSSPKTNVYIHSLDLDADNISNAAKKNDRLPSTAKLSGTFLKSGQIKADMKMNVLSEPFEADLDASIKKLNLQELNKYTDAYAGFDFEKGTIEVTTEVAATTAKFDGYVKTILRDVDVLDYSKERAQGDSVLKLAWEGLVGSVIEIFENQKREQFAARIPIAGSRDAIEFRTWPAIGSIIKNAFYKAIDPKFEDSVKIIDATQSGTSRSKKGE